MSGDDLERKVETALSSEPSQRDARAGSPARPDDSDILAALRGGDRKGAIGLCARRHGEALGRLCMALLGSQAEADDAVQETLLAAHGSFDAFRGEGTVRAWLFGIARRRCARSLEQRSKAERRVGANEIGASADELLEARRRAEIARRLLARVRPTEREALLLRYLGELSFREVGQACGIDEATARKRVSRALARLREATEERT